MKNLKKLIIFTFILLVFSGCSSNKPADTHVGSENIEINGIPIFAYLEKTEDGYRFTSFSADTEINEPWVNLNKGKPTWHTGTETDCNVGIARLTKAVGRCKTINEDLFREFSTRIGMTAFVTVFTFGVGALAPNGDVVFNMEEFKAAYNEAKENMIKRSPERENVIKEYVSKVNSLAKSLDREYSYYTKKYFSVNDRAKIKLKINDESGLFSGQINFSKFIHIKNNKIKKNEDMMLSYKAESLPKLIEGMNLQYSKILNSWKKESSVINVNCNKKEHSNFIFDIQCPSTVKINKGNVAIPVNITIHYKTYNRLTPSFMRGKDENIIYKFDGYNLKVSNRSNKYISVDSVSFYHNGRIANVKELSKELPPYSENNVANVWSLPVDLDALRFSRVTKKTARYTRLEYGFAIKYRIIDTNKEKTLYSVKEYSLYDLINS